MPMVAARTAPITPLKSRSRRRRNMSHKRATRQRLRPNLSQQRHLRPFHQHRHQFSKYRQRNHQPRHRHLRQRVSMGTPGAMTLPLGHPFIAHQRTFVVASTFPASSPFGVALVTLCSAMMACTARVAVTRDHAADMVAKGQRSISTNPREVQRRALPCVSSPASPPFVHTSMRICTPLLYLFTFLGHAVYRASLGSIRLPLLPPFNCILFCNPFC